MSRRFRVLACDQDPVVNGAIGHLLGVALHTPALLDQRTHSVSVEIVGEYVTTSSLMAPLQSERFAASTYMRRPFSPHPTVVVTLSGIGEALRESIVKLDVPVVCLSEFSMVGETDEVGLERFICPPEHPCAECVSREFGKTVDSIRLAELCKRFAMVFARDYGR